MTIPKKPSSSLPPVPPLPHLPPLPGPPVAPVAPRPAALTPLPLSGAAARPLLGLRGGAAKTGRAPGLGGPPTDAAGSVAAAGAGAGADANQGSVSAWDPAGEDTGEPQLLRASWGVAWCASAALLAAGSAWALVAAFGVAAVWSAPLAAAGGALVAAITLAHLAPRWRVAEPPLAPEPQPQTALSPLGVSKPLFMELAAREWARARRHGSGAALLIVHIDRFARLAQARGPQAIEAVLLAMLKDTAPTLRGADVLTVFSECEIAIFLAPADATGALDVAERIRERTEQLEVPWGLGEGSFGTRATDVASRLRVTVSIGVALLRPAHLNLQALLDDAEDAVAAARQVGGNCVRAAPVEPSHLRSPGGPGSSENPGNWRDGNRA